MSDHHYHYEYAEARHDHRGDYADERHDHDLDYAEKHHRHYDDERAIEELRGHVRELRAIMIEFGLDLSEAQGHIRALEEQAPDARQAELEADLAAVGQDQYDDADDGDTRVWPDDWSEHPCEPAPPEEDIMTGRTYTHPDVLTLGVTEGWAEAETDPARIDWPERQARAAIPFEVVDGRPVNPCEQTAIRYGRNEFGHWGEALMADALVTVIYSCDTRYLLMVERGDGYGWAVPGGHVEPGEIALQAAVRELAEETGYKDVRPSECAAGAPRYVPDPRSSDEAWAVTVPVHISQGMRYVLPEVSGGDDARRAEWVAASSFDMLTAELAYRFHGRVFAAHVDMLREFLGEEVAHAEG